MKSTKDLEVTLPLLPEGLPLGGGSFVSREALVKALPALVGVPVRDAEGRVVGEVASAQVEAMLEEAAHTVESTLRMGLALRDPADVTRLFEGFMPRASVSSVPNRPPPFCVGGRVGFNCRPNAGGIDHHVHCPKLHKG